MGKPETRSKPVDKTDNTDVPVDKMDEMTEKLISKICAKFSRELEIKFSANFNTLHEKLDEVTTTLKKLDQTVNNNVMEIKAIDRKCEIMEQHEKRKSIRINGLPEEGNENLLQVVLNFLNNKLKIPCRDTEIDNVYRVYNNNNKDLKPVILEFVTNIKRNQVYFAKKVLKGSSIQIYENLTKYRYNLLTLAKAKYGKHAAWSIGGKIFIVENNMKRVINSSEDI